MDDSASPPPQDDPRMAGVRSIYVKALADANRAFEEKVRELSTVRRVSDTLLVSNDLAAILRATIDIVFEEVAPDRCFISLLAPNGEDLYVQAERTAGGHGSRYAPQGSADRFLIGEGVTGRVVATLRNRLVGETEGEPGYDPRADGQGVRSLLALPLQLSGKGLGALTLASDRPGYFTPEHERLLVLVTNYLAIAVSNALLVDHLLERERLSALGNMAATMIHDMKTPLHVIGGFAELLAEADTGAEERREYLGIINSQLSRFLALAEGTLEYARGSESRLLLRQVELRGMAAEVETMFRSELSNHRLMLESEVMGNRPVRLDPDRMIRVIGNLVNNARDAMTGGGRLRITYDGSDPEQLRIVVADTGPGIPEAIRTTLFEPFVTMGKTSGTGLGLAIVRKIIDQHLGTILVESEERQGTTFTITLPA